MTRLHVAAVMRENHQDILARGYVDVPNLDEALSLAGSNEADYGVGIARKTTWTDCGALDRNRFPVSTTPTIEKEARLETPWGSAPWDEIVVLPDASGGTMVQAGLLCQDGEWLVASLNTPLSEMVTTGWYRYFHLTMADLIRAYSSPERAVAWVAPFVDLPAEQAGVLAQQLRENRERRNAILVDTAVQQSQVEEIKAGFDGRKTVVVGVTDPDRPWYAVVDATADEPTLSFYASRVMVESHLLGREPLDPEMRQAALDAADRKGLETFRGRIQEYATARAAAIPAWKFETQTEGPQAAA